MTKYAFALIFLFASHPLSAAPKNGPVLKIVGPRGTQTFSISELAKLATKEKLEVKAAPAYGYKKKIFIGIHLLDLIEETQPFLDFTKPFTVKVTTLDGWTAPLYPAELLVRGNALLATREAKETITEPKSKDGLWTMAVDPKSKKEIHPGPFYLVWNDTDKNPDVMPLQVQTIEIIQ
jgi:hypothetical protein